MNNDLISREQTKDFFHDEQEYFGYTIKKTLDIVPTAKQTQDVGQWIKHEDYNESIKYGCSRCGNLTNIPSNYCPNCGQAKKKGGGK